MNIAENELDKIICKRLDASLSDISKQFCKSVALSSGVETDMGCFIPKLFGTVKCVINSTNTQYNVAKDSVHRIYEGDTMISERTVSPGDNQSLSSAHIITVKPFLKYRLTIQPKAEGFIGTSSMYAGVTENIDRYIITDMEE